MKGPGLERSESVTLVVKLPFFRAGGETMRSLVGDVSQK